MVLNSQVQTPSGCRLKQTAHCLSGLLKHPVFFRLPRRLTKQRLQATPTPLVMLLQSPSMPRGHEERESSPQSS